MHVPQYLADQHIVFETIVHPPAYSAQQLAKRLHVSGRHVVKAVLLSGPSGFFIAVLPATHQIDTDSLTTVFGGTVRLASDLEIAGVFPDCEWGVVPPFGVLYGLPTSMKARPLSRRKEPWGHP